MNQNLTRQDVQKMIEEYADSAQYGVRKVAFHVHNNLDSPQIPYGSLTQAPHYYTVAKNTNGTTNVNVFGTGGAPFPLTAVGVFVISLDTTAGNITLLRRADTVCTIAKGTVAGVMVGATSLSNTTYKTGDVCQVDSSTAGNATVFITFTF